jgi:hypothetical protein
VSKIHLAVIKLQGESIPYLNKNLGFQCFKMGLGKKISSYTCTDPMDRKPRYSFYKRFAQSENAGVMMPKQQKIQTEIKQTMIDSE